MPSGPISLTVEGEVYNLVKINQDNRTGLYRAWSADGTRRLHLKISHTDPSASEPGESHLFRCDLETFNAVGQLVRTTPAWFVLATRGSAQDTAELKSLYDGMVAALEASTDALLTAVLNGEP